MRMKEFYDRVTEGMALRELWDQFKSEAQSSYQLYSEDIDWKTIEKLPVLQRCIRIGKAFFWAMLMHLSVTRRVILLFSIVLSLLGLLPPYENRPSFAFYGSLGLLLVLALELADRVILKRDLEIAREIQKWLVPEEAPQLAEVDIAFATRPANTVGGDFYDLILDEVSTSPKKLLLVMADVAGKSVPAALLMATFQASLRALLASNPTLDVLASMLNRAGCERSDSGRRFTTAFLGEIVMDSRRLRYINAGHNYPILRRTGGQIERLRTGGLPFGIQADSGYKVGSVDLKQGDLLVIFTDGVVEAVNSSGEEFGEGRLCNLVERLSEATAQQSLERLQQELEGFVGQARQHDDMTWFFVRVL